MQPSLVDITLQSINTPNSADPIASADSVNITEFSWNGIKSTHILKHNQNCTGQNPDPNCALVQANNSFHVLEGTQTSATLNGRFGSIDVAGFSNVADPLAGFLSIVTVPEPGTFSLLSAGLLGFILKSNLRSRKKQLI
jgi:PEP-CTERM motif